MPYRASLAILVSRSPVVRVGIAHFVQHLSKITHCEQVTALDSALELMAHYEGRFVVLLDVKSLGSEAISIIKAEHPSALIVGIIGKPSHAKIANVLALRAHGVVSMQDSAEELSRVLSDVLDGRITVSGRLSAENSPPVERRKTGKSKSILGDSLTPRQRDVIGLLGPGVSNKAIARRLGLSECTVKIHMSAAFRQLGVNSRAAAFALFRS